MRKASKCNIINGEISSSGFSQLLLGKIHKTKKNTIFDACLYFFSTLLKTCSQVSQISCLRIASVQKNPPFNRFVRKANVLKKQILFNFTIGLSIILNLVMQVKDFCPLRVLMTKTGRGSSS